MKRLIIALLATCQILNAGLNTGGSGAGGGGGTGTVTSIDMTVPSGFSVTGVPITNSGTIAMTLGAVPQTLISLADPGADRIVMWDDSANSYAFMTTGTNLTITGTTLDATGGGSSQISVDGSIVSNPDFTDGGDINFAATGSTVTGTVGANSVALTTDTTGNYVTSVATTSPLTGGASASEGATLTLAISGDGIGPTQIDETANYSWTGIHEFDSDAVQIDDGVDGSHQLIITPGSNLTSDRVLTINTGDSARQLTLSGDANISGTATGTNTGDQTITLTGDVTGSGTGSFATTIADNAVDGGDISLGSEAQGNIMYNNGTDWVVLAPSTDGLVLHTHGAGANPTWDSDDGAGGGAPVDATYITQTVNGTLSNEQALSSLSTGIVRVATTTGVLTSLTDSSGIATNISDETGTGVLTFATAPTFTTNISVGSAGVRLTAGDGSVTWLGLGSGADEDLTLNLNDAANTATVSSSTGVTAANFSAIGLQESGNAVPNATDTLAFFASTTSAQLAGVLSDESGSGSAIFGTAPTFTTSLAIGSAGVRLSDDGDGALTLLGLGNGSDEDLTFNLDDTSNEVTITSSTGLATANFSAIALAESGNAVPNSSDHLGFFASTTSAQLAGVLTNETGTGVAVFGTAPTFTTSITTPILVSAAADPADAGAIRLGNAELIEWEASPAGTDVTLTVDTSEVMQASGTFNASTLTEGGTSVPNTGDNLSVFAATTSAQLAGIISNETGSGSAVFGTSPTIATPVITGAVSWEDGTRQTFNPDGTNAGLNVGSQAGDPSSLSNGDIWYNSSANSLYGRIGGTTVALGAGTGDVTAASSFGTDNVLIKSDGTGKGVQATGISVDDSNNITGITTFTSTTVSAGTLEFEGTTADANEMSIAVEDPTSDRTFTLRNATGTALISGDTLTGDVTATFDTDGSSVTTIAANSVALGTDTTGNYAAGDAEAGAALTGDSATAFFTSGQIERARGGTGADTSAYGAGLLGSDGSNNTIDVDTTLEFSAALGMTPSSALQSQASASSYYWNAATTVAFAAENTTASSSTQGAFGALFSNDGTAMSSGDRLGGLFLGGSSSASALRPSAAVIGYAAQTWADGSAYGTRLAFESIATGATSRTERMAVEGNGLVSFGGSTSSFPAIRRTSAAINFRLADDSADAAITAAGATFSGAITESASAVPNATDNLGFFSATSSAQFAGVINDETGTGSVVLATSPTFVNASIGNGGTSAGVLTLLEDTDAGSNFASFQVPSLAANTVYILPADDGDAGEQLTTDGTGNLTWESAGGGGAGGDIDAVGDVASGAAFNGTQGTLLTFNDADGDLTFGTNATANTLQSSAPIDLGSAGVRLSGDGDGAITFLGLGDGSDEDLTINLDDTSNTATVTSSTGLATANFSGIALQESGNAVPNVTDNLSVFAATSSAQLITLVSDETGTGALVFGTSPTLTTPRFADLGYIADANGNEMLIFDSVASAVNNLQITNAASGSVPQIDAVGNDTNIDINFQAKGSGFYRFNGTTNTSAAMILKERTDNGTEEVLLAAPVALASSPIVTLPSSTGTLVISGGDIGAATATTASANTNTTQVSTTAYVQSELTAYASDTVTFTNKTLTTPIISSISNTGTVTLPTSTDTLVAKATTDTFTNKTLDAAATGNVVKTKSLPQFISPFRVQGTNATIGTTATAVGYGLVTFSNSVDEASNWAEWRILVPADFDTAVDPRIKLADMIGADTAARQYTISVASVASSASVTSPTLGTAIDVNMSADGSGAANDAQISATTTLTGWGAALTPGQIMVIRVARDGDQATQDASTVNSTLLCFEFEYGSTQ